MLTFFLGGISGLMNASFSMNLRVHNTAFIPGHFHLTLGTAVALSYMGIAYWLIPYLYGRRLWSARLGVFQAFAYFGGVLIFSRGLMMGGMEGMPRRTQLALSTVWRRGTCPESWPRSAARSCSLRSSCFLSTC